VLTLSTTKCDLAETSDSSQPSKERVRQQVYTDPLADTFCLKGVRTNVYAASTNLGRAYFSPINCRIIGSMAEAHISYPFSLG
jgi:hypothetical protein